MKTNTPSADKAYVLHARAYRETSLLVDFFCEHTGRIAVIARGARRPRSKIRALLEPFSPLYIEWFGKSDLVTLRQIEAAGLPLRPRGACLLSGFYLNELLIRLLHRHDPHITLFNYYTETLAALSQSDSPEPILRIFEKQLLTELGFGLTLSQEVLTAAPVIPEQYYTYYPEQGFCAIEQSTNNNQANTFLGKSLLAIAQNQFNDAKILQDAKRLMRLALKPLLGDKPLKSRALFKSKV